jgi:hypothetical protein
MPNSCFQSALSILFLILYFLPKHFFFFSTVFESTVLFYPCVSTRCLDSKHENTIGLKRYRWTFSRANPYFSVFFLYFLFIFEFNRLFNTLYHCLDSWIKITIGLNHIFILVPLLYVLFEHIFSICLFSSIYLNIFIIDLNIPLFFYLNVVFNMSVPLPLSLNLKISLV